MMVVVLIVFVTFAVIAKPVYTEDDVDSGCLSLVKAASLSDDPECEPLEGCIGLTCYSNFLDVNTTFEVDKCTDPVQVNVTVTNEIGNVLLMAVVDGPTSVKRDGFNVTFNTFRRNASYLIVMASSMQNNMQYTVIPYTEIPLNASYCMCESIKQMASNIQSPVVTSCVTSMKCIGVECEFVFGEMDFFVENEIIQCNNPPGFLLVIRSKMNNAILFDSYFDRSTNVTLFGSPLFIIIEQKEYSMIIQVNLLLADFLLTITPRSQVILDLADCLPITEPSPEPTSLPGIPVVSDETCDAIKQIVIAANGQRLAKCNVTPECDTIKCLAFNNEETDFQLLQCNNPPAIRGTIYDESGTKIYDEILTNSTEIQLDLFTVVIKIEQLPDAIGLEVDIETEFGIIPYIPYSEIPIDTCFCPNITCDTAPNITCDTAPNITCDTAKESKSIVAAVVVPIVVILFLIAVIIAVVFGVVLFIKHKKPSGNTEFKEMTEEVIEKEATEKDENI